MTKTEALDLFAGAGGWGVALDSLGIVHTGIDNDKDACSTARAAGHRQLEMDVQDLDSGCAKDIGLVASPPCQTWSQAGSRSAHPMLYRMVHAVSLVRSSVTDALTTAGVPHTDERTRLVLEPMRIIYRSLPVWVAMEQVPSVLPVWEAYVHAMRPLGYSATCGILHAEQYGVPQTRTRAFLLASREHEVHLPVPTHSRYYPRNPARLDPRVRSWVSMARALSWGLADRPSPTVTGGGTETGGAEPIAHLKRYTTRPGWVPTTAVPGDTSWTALRPSPTIVGSFAPDVVAAPGWRKPGDPPRQKTPGSVRVSVQEAGLLQGFPADYPWQGSKTSQYRQVGNAVPPPLAMAVLAEVI